MDDAWATGEYWITQPVAIKQADSAILRIDSFNMACMGRSGLKDFKDYVYGDKDIVTNVRTTRVR